MKQYTQKIDSLQDAFEYLVSLYNDGLLYHFDDDVNTVSWNKDLSQEVLARISTRTSEARAIFDSEGIDIFYLADFLHKFGNKVILWREDGEVFFSHPLSEGCISIDSWGIDIGMGSFNGDISTYDDGRDDERPEIDWLIDGDEMPESWPFIEGIIISAWYELLRYRKNFVVQGSLIPTKEEAFGIYYEGES